MILDALNPSLPQIGGVFTALSKIDPVILRALLKSLDEQALRRLSLWSQAFIAHMNEVHHESEGHEMDVAGEPDFSTDFFEAMRNTRYAGKRLTFEDLELASNHITKAIKAQNWSQAIWTGISLAKVMAI